MYSDLLNNIAANLIIFWKIFTHTALLSTLQDFPHENYKDWELRASCRDPTFPSLFTVTFEEKLDFLINNRRYCSRLYKYSGTFLLTQVFSKLVKINRTSMGLSKLELYNCFVSLLNLKCLDTLKLCA